MSIMVDDNGGASILEMEIDIDIDAMEEVHWSPEAAAAVGDDSVGGDMDDALGKSRLLLRDVTSPRNDLNRVLPKLAKRINTNVSPLSSEGNAHVYADTSLHLTETTPSGDNGEYLATAASPNGSDHLSPQARGQGRSSRTRGSLLVHLSRGLAPELEQLRTQDINPDEDSAAYRALKRISTPKEERSPESTDDAAVAVDSRVKMKKQKKQRNIEGREIKQGHKQYELTYGMMLGMRVMTGRCDVELPPNSPPPQTGRASSFNDLRPSSANDWSSLSAAAMLAERELGKEDFGYALELTFRPEGSTDSLYPTPPHKLKHPFKFKDYMPKVFRAIRGLSKIEEDDYMISVAGDFNYIEFLANSKSGQFFFYSHDGKYMIKTQTQEECVLLRRIMLKYVQHLTIHPDSLLVRFYGMHRVKFRTTKTIYFVIMSSVFDTDLSIDVKYDLKGSLHGRITADSDCLKGAVQKDLNLVRSGHRLRIGERNADLFHDTLQADVALLQELNIMDYSLLVGIHFGSNRSQAKTDTVKARRASGVELTKSQVQMIVNKDRDKDRECRNSEGTEVSDQDAEYGSIFSSYHGGIRGGGTAASSDDEPDIYFLGIIDILQLYDVGKRTESMVKSMYIKRSELSAVRPNLYAQRMLEFVLRHTDYEEMKEAERERQRGRQQQQVAKQPKKSSWNKISHFLKEKKKDRLDLL